MADTKIRFLTQSFRFGPAVTHVANVTLSFKGKTVNCRGLASTPW